jgi:hypothetical protein
MRLHILIYILLALTT